MERGGGRRRRVENTYIGLAGCRIHTHCLYYLLGCIIRLARLVAHQFGKSDRKTSGWKMRLRMGGDCRESCVGCFFVVARGIPALLWRNCKGLREASNPIAVRCCPIISVEGRSWQWPEARDEGAALIKGVNSWMYRYRHLLIALHWFFFSVGRERQEYMVHFGKYLPIEKGSNSRFLSVYKFF